LGSAYVNQGQIGTGMAWNFIDHGFDPVLARAEEEAQDAGIGIWSEPSGP
jgi:endonuclease YncB( thermonuclease family)